MLFESCIRTPIGYLTAVDDGFALLKLQTAPEATEEKITGSVAKELKVQLGEYFDGKRKEFTIPFILKGTPFQKEAWMALCDIPYGETRSYKEQAESLGRPNAYRAVGGANHLNPIMILVPCHRVVGADGRLKGYAGGLEIKQFLLDLEQKYK
ncbi:MAG: methylated-DNA--[protein]-cysteine S-methyltransferase [Lachnospiraceae bacterium]|nr:methylated-DNA--[protein]-cysteine S-methyltransferase [Lachnospiraceae bacterium]